MGDYQIFTDATADMSQALLAGLPTVRVIPMCLEIGGREYTYGPGGNITPKDFYDLQRAGNFASSSQINPASYIQAFQPVLEAGIDILYLCFTSGMSGTIQSAQVAMEDLRNRFPQRKLMCVDTLCASAGEGFLVHEAARKQSEGLTLEELTAWVLSHRLRVCHWFTVDVFQHLVHGGRVSASSAAVGTVLQIKPLLHVDHAGRLAVMEKPRGRKKAICTQLNHMEAGWTPDEGKLVVIGHGDCPEAAEQLQAAVIARFPEAQIHIVDIGPIIGAHTGPGMLALIYWGENR